MKSNLHVFLIVGKVVIESKKRKLQDYSNIPEDIVSEASKAPQLSDEMLSVEF